MDVRWQQWKGVIRVLCLGVFIPTPAAPADPHVTPWGDLVSSVLALESAVSRQPDAGRETGTFSVYLNAAANDLRLHSLSARWGDALPHTVDLNHHTSEALRAGGVYRLELPAAGSDNPTLKIELMASRLVSGARIARLRLPFSADVAAVHFLEVALTEEGLRNRHTLAPPEAPSSERTLRVRDAERLLNTGHPYQAAIALIGLEAQSESDGEASALLLRARQALAFAPASPSARSHAPGTVVAARFTQAGQWLAAGRRDEAWTALMAVADDDDASPTRRVMRDRANLALAELALSEGRGEQAGEHFRRVHSPGPYASRALLGLGWSYLLSNKRLDSSAIVGETARLAPHARLQAVNTLRPASTDEAAELRRLSPFRYAGAVASGARRENLQRALNVWQELIGRDPSDPVVQEGMLATAYAFDHLGAHQQAVQRYQRALEQMLAARGHLGDAIRHVEQGAFFAAMETPEAAAPDAWPWWLIERRDARWWMNDAKQPNPLFYVEHLLERDAFRQRLADYQILRAMALRLDQLARQQLGLETEINALQQRVETRLWADREQIEVLAVQDLQQLLALTDTYLAEAHLALARLYDQPDAGADPLMAIP